jgi:hypothetical protein
MLEQAKISGVEITVVEANGDFVCAPAYEAHTAARVLEIIEATKQLLTNGRTMTHRVY